MFAVHWYQSNGPIREWEEVCSADVMASKAAKSIPLPPKDVKQLHDSAWDEDGDYIFSQLERTAVFSIGVSEPSATPSSPLLPSEPSATPSPPLLPSNPISNHQPLVTKYNRKFISPSSALHLVDSSMKSHNDLN